jgi:hypothetical protein
MLKVIQDFAWRVRRVKCVLLHGEGYMRNVGAGGGRACDICGVEARDPYRSLCCPDRQCWCNSEMFREKFGTMEPFHNGDIVKRRGGATYRIANVNPNASVQVVSLDGTHRNYLMGIQELEKVLERV